MEDILNEIKLLAEAPPEIREQCIVRLQNMIGIIDLDNMLITRRLTILCQMIDTARINNAKKDIVNTILKRWDPTQTDTIDPDGILGDLAATFICSMENLKYLTTLYQYCTPMTVLDSHIRSRMDSGMIFSIVADRIFEAYEVETLHGMEWEQLVKAADDSQTLKSKRHTAEILSYIQDKLTKNPGWISNKKIVVKKPEWVSNKKIEEDSPDQIRKVLNETLEKIDMESAEFGQDIQSILDKTLQNSSKEECRIKGPVNPILGFDCISTNEPCRMFSCMCREDDDIEEWFIGHCEICKKIIRHYRYAIRLPVVGGGFIGCFCGFDCLYKTDLPLGEDNDRLIDDLQEILNTVGIQDIE